MSTREVASEMGIPMQAVRELAKKGELPFALTLKKGKTFSYYFFKERYELWKSGRL